MDQQSTVGDALRSLLAGDLTDFDTILKADSEDLQAAAPPTLILERSGLLEVLRAWERGDLVDSQVQAWASFMRHGHGPGSGQCRPLDIEYDPASEDLIVEVMHRLDELGDSIDGTVSDDERAGMIRALGGIPTTRPKRAWWLPWLT